MSTRENMPRYPPENYRCIEKDELQSGYFGKTEVSIHVSVIYRHAVVEYDHANENELVSELMFCISPDCTHDHFFVAKVHEEMKSHIDSIGYKTDKMNLRMDAVSNIRAIRAWGGLP
ncbi:hypothetical protein DPMN_171028 [Dreissena polymorpha]|uniref:Uncharacterized protein n=1 Tax=Dreissena polymorpha TaxID=45954 RepID=A0A9D4DZ04_DREPO|nr:hypothetical protein DPMN_171028 [Dreissena polymorpha]